MSKIDERFLFNKNDTAEMFGVSVQSFSKRGLEPHEKRGRQQFIWPGPHYA